MEGTTKNGNRPQLNGSGHSFNMLDAVDNLKDSGVEEDHAKAIVQMQYSFINSYVATKRDLEIVRHDIEELKAATKRDIEELRKEAKHDSDLIRVDMEKFKVEAKNDLDIAKLELKQDIKGIDLKIENIRAELKKDIENVQAGLKKDMRTMETGLEAYIGNQNWKMLGLTATLLALFVAILKLVLSTGA